MKKVAAILNGLIVIALGLVVAIAGGPGRAFDLALGIVLIIDAAIMLAEMCLLLRATKILPVAHTVAFALFFVFGMALTAGWLGIGWLLIEMLIWGIIAVGGALVLLGTWTIVKGLVFTGIGQIVVGAVAMTLAILTMKVPGMYQAFNIILGVIVTGYGLLLLVMALTGLGKKEKKAE